MDNNKDYFILYPFPIIDDDDMHVIYVFIYNAVMAVLYFSWEYTTKYELRDISNYINQTVQNITV